MPDVFVELRVRDTTFRARVLGERSPAAARTLLARLPFDGRLGLDEWSGALGRIRGVTPPPTTVGDAVVAFAYPGLVMLDPANGDLAVCWGQGRLQNGFGPQPAIPLLEIGGDLRPLAALGTRIQYDGALPVRLARAADQASPLAEAPRERGRRIALRLGDATALADLLEESSPVTAASFVTKLPLEGIATNTFVSGPLVRWRPADGSEAEFPLESAERESSHSILYPGFVYYRPVAPRGLRIATRDATTMGGGIIGRATRLAPLARFTGDWSAFKRAAAALSDTGQQRLRISLE